jgi:flagellar biosynthesis/type III secretory pathway M-ring protein FliF/YscJ
MRLSSTGRLVMLSAARLSPAQKSLWYAIYAAALWVAVALVVAIYAKNLARRRSPRSAALPQNV